MRAELLLGGFLFNLLSNCHGGPAECNTTFEFGHNTRLSLQSPKQRTGASLVCWYNLQIIEGSGLEVFQIYVNRFSVGTLEPSGCVGGYLQIHDSEYESVNKVQSFRLDLENILDFQELGFHCGEAEQPKQIIREARSIKLTFLVDEYNWNAEWDFRVEAVTKSGVPGRYGSHPERFPGKVGKIITLQ